MAANPTPPTLGTRRYEISSALFGGFTRQFDVEGVGSLDEIARMAREDLAQTLVENNLHHLASEALRRRFCVHDVWFDDVRAGVGAGCHPGHPIWVCDACPVHAEAAAAADTGEGDMLEIEGLSSIDWDYYDDDGDDGGGGGGGGGGSFTTWRVDV